MTKRFYIIFLISGLLFGCNSGKTKNDLEGLLSELQINLESDPEIYVFYGLSCKSCTDQIILFVKNSLSNMNSTSHFVFTDVHSKKYIDIIFGSISDHPRVTIDLKYRFYPFLYKKGIVFPIKLILKHGRISGIQSLETDYFAHKII